MIKIIFLLSGFLFHPHAVNNYQESNEKHELQNYTSAGEHFNYGSNLLAAEDLSPGDKKRPPQQNISYQLGNKKVTEEAVLKRSENQNYSLYVFEQFELAEEEPGKDIMFSKEQPDIWMRIEVLPVKADDNWEPVIEQTKAYFEAGFGQVKTSPSPDSFKGLLLKDTVAAYEAKSKKEQAHGYLIKGKGKRPPLRITTVTPLNSHANTTLLKMAETIETN